MARSLRTRALLGPTCPVQFLTRRSELPDLTHHPHRQAACHQRVSSAPTLRIADRCKRAFKADTFANAASLLGSTSKLR